MTHRPAHHHTPFTHLPIAWREAGYAALRLHAADTCDDRVTEDIFDADGECEVVEMMVRRMRPLD